jgi:hypothetical protein
VKGSREHKGFKREKDRLAERVRIVCERDGERERGFEHKEFKREHYRLSVKR